MANAKRVHPRGNKTRMRLCGPGIAVCRPGDGPEVDVLADQEGAEGKESDQEVALRWCLWW